MAKGPLSADSWILPDQGDFDLEKDIEVQLPEWASRLADEGEMTKFQQAYTKDGSRNGNGVIMEVGFRRNQVAITVVTEAGNLINNMTLNEFNELFTAGKYVMKSFPTTQSEKAWYARNVS